MLGGLLAILGFVAIMTVLIIIHEAGHFFVAKLAKVKVMEFGLGFPPRLWGIRYGDTLYSINAIPLGGFVRMLGEEDPSEAGSLAGRGTGTRFLVMVAGPFMNFILTVLLFSVLFMIPQDVPVGQVAIQEVVPSSPAEQAGILAGDIIIAVDGRDLDSDIDLRYSIALNLGKEMTWIIERGRERFPVEITARLNPPEGQGATGILVTTLNVHFERRSEPFWSAPILGLERTGQVLVLVKNEFVKWVSGGSSPEVMGPIGMAQIFGEVVQVEEFRFVDRVITVINLSAVISLSLAIFNILPIPALDGGRIMFVVIEWVRRGKRIPPQREGIVHLVGFVMLITLGLLISLVDLGRIFRGESLLGG